MLDDLVFTKERVREIRRRLGISQEQFAVRVNVTLGAVSLWESGRRTPTRPDVLMALIALEQELGRASG